MLKFSEIFEFSKEKFRKFPILKEFEWFEWFEWVGPSPTEPFNPGGGPREAEPRPLQFQLGPGLRQACTGTPPRFAGNAKIHLPVDGISG